MYSIGIDLGGTNIAAGIVDENSKIIIKDSVPTGRTRSFDEILADMVELLRKLLKDAGIDESEVLSIGIGCPGNVDMKNKSVLYANNIPSFNNAPIGKELKRHFENMDIYVENDANAAAYGEYIAGAAKDNKDIIAITLGTGVGGGIIIDGKIYGGVNYAGAEFGHMVIEPGGVPCSCGRCGCWEQYASVTALISQTEEKIKKYPDSKIHEMIKKDGKISGRTAFDAMRSGDIAGKEIVDDFIRHIAVGTINLINIFQPEKIVIGGGISKEGDTILVPLKKFIDNEEYARDMENLSRTKVVMAELGNDAGIIGAAMLYKQTQ